MQSTRSNFILLTTVILMDLLSGMEFDLFVPSFPELQQHFQLTPGWVEALLSVNFIGYCISLFFVGGLADRYGRKPIILLGLMIFTLGSLFCVWSSAYYLLLIGRFLQGIGIAAPAILSFLIIADAYPIEKQQFYLAMLNGAMNASVAAAPVIGSYIALYFHWKGNFITLLILGIIVLCLTAVCIPTLSKPKSTHSPVGYLTILRTKPLLLLIVYFITMFIPYWIFVGMTPLLFMKNLGVPLTHFGFYQGILALIFGLGSVIHGFAVSRLNHQKTLHVSTFIFLISIVTIGLVSFNAHASALWITLALVPFVIAQIFPTTILYPVCLNYLPNAKGRTAALMQGGRLIFSSLGLQLAGFCYQGSFQNIGLLLMTIILIGVTLQFFVLNNREIMTFDK